MGNRQTIYSIDKAVLHIIAQSDIISWHLQIPSLKGSVRIVLYFIPSSIISSLFFVFSYRQYINFGIRIFATQINSSGIGC